MLRMEIALFLVLAFVAYMYFSAEKQYTELHRTFSVLLAAVLVNLALDGATVYTVNHLDDVLEEFDRVIGLNRLKAIHLNDSKNPLGSHKDRHEKIGEGSLGEETFARVINHPALRHLPFFLETPNDLDGYAREIALLKSLRSEP